MADIDKVTVDELDVTDTTEDGDKLIIETGDGKVKSVSKKNLLLGEASTREAADTLLQGQITTLAGESGLEEKANLSLKGSANGLAELDENGKIPMSQIPGGADDIRPCYGEVTWDEFGNVTNIEVYDDAEHTQKTVPESNIVYLDVGDTKSNHYEYMWAGDSETGAWGRLGSSIVIGESASNAYRGDRGKIAYDHSQIRGTGTETENNPHALSPTDIGLGNVPNVTTNNQTPTYEVAEKNTELESGETLSAAFGKLARIVKSFIAHLADKANPHEVTKTQVGLGDVENYGRDTAVTSGSGNYITSGAVYTTASQKNDKITVTDDTSELTDSDSFDETAAGTNPTATKRRLLTSLWAYIKNKIDTVLGLTATSYGGNSATATNALYSAAIGSSTSHGAIGSKTSPVYVDENGQVHECTGISPSVIDMTKAVNILAIANGGTGATTAANARSNLGLGAAAVKGVDEAGSTSSTNLLQTNVATSLSNGAVCSTAIGTQAKTVALTGFTLFTGAVVRVLFSNGNSAASPTLNVNSTGAKAIKIYKNGSKENYSTAIAVGRILVLFYDGTDWLVTANSDNVNCPFPVGGTYVQFPQQDAPATLWLGTVWSEIDYGGAFFRAKGGNADAFIEKSGNLVMQQDALQSHTHTVMLNTTDSNFYPGNSGSSAGTARSSGSAQRTTSAPSGRTATETRPVNYTIRIWRRTA